MGAREPKSGRFAPWCPAILKTAAYYRTQAAPTPGPEIKMIQTAIFAPFLTTMLLTLVVWFYMYSRRIPLIQSSKINPNKLTPAELARISPPSVSNPSDNLKNLFELPRLYCISGLALWFMVVRAALSAL
jgi:hypothetical protein